VHSSEFSLGKDDKRDNHTFLFYKLAKQCSIQIKGKAVKDCVLMTGPSKFIDIKSLDERYTTTVNFHSKLRETLIMLLHFSPKGL
jgi:hypothetical protein